MNFPYQILELELEPLFIFYKRWDKNPAEPFLRVYWIKWLHYRFQS